MTDDDPPTSRPCPACGVERRDDCKLCEGRGLVTPWIVAAWLARQKDPRTKTSTTFRSLPLRTNEAILALERRGTAQTDRIVERGKELLKRIQASPLDADALEKLSAWIADVQVVLRGER